MTFFNAAMCRIANVSPKELLGMNYREYTSPDTAKEMFRVFNEIFTTSKPATLKEYEIIWKNGIQRNLELSVSLIRDRQKTPIGFRGIARDVTEKKRLEEMYRTVAEKSFAGVFIIQKGVFQYANANVTAYTGYAPEELIGRKTETIVHPDDLKALKQCAIEMLKGTRKLPYEYRIITRDGEIRWIIETVTPILIKGERALVGNSMDITEHKKRDQELINISRLYALLSRVNQSVVHALSPDQFLRDVCQAIVDEGDFKLGWIGRRNPETEEILPIISCGEAKEFTRGIVVFADDRPEGHSPTGTCIREGRPCIINDFMHDPRTFPWRERAAAFGFRDTAGFPITVGGQIWGALSLYASKANYFGDKETALLEEAAHDIGFALDNLERERLRKQAEETLKESEERYRLSFENASDVIYSIDRDFRVISISPSAEKILGYKPEEIVGRSIEALTNIIAPESMDAALSNTIEVLNGKNITDAVYSFIAKDGTRKIGEVSGSPIIRGGTIVGAISIARDITKRKWAEEALENSLANLRKTLGATIQAMAMAVETKDPYTAGHQRRVADLARTIATEMGLKPEKIDGVRLAGLIHDLGKLAVPSEILSKPTTLSKIEMQLVRTHAQAGYDILKDMEFPWPIARMILEHHERMDGSGYPRGIKGEDILPESRILSVADVVEAIATHRPYRPAHGMDVALVEIKINRGLLYDPEVVDACLRVFEKGYNLSAENYNI